MTQVPSVGLLRLTVRLPRKWAVIGAGLWLFRTVGALIETLWTARAV